MLKTTFYFNTNSGLAKDKINLLIESKDVNEKILGMKELISQLSQGKIYESIIHTIVKEVLMLNNNELKRLFYYFLELYTPLMNDGELLMLSNQIRKDLEHPNEFIRGLTLRYVSTLSSNEVLQNFFKPICDNFSHPISYVRRNAYYCLGTIHKRLGIFDETSELLYNALLRDSDSYCLSQAFNMLYDIDVEKAKAFAYELKNTRSHELSLAMIEKIQEDDFLSVCLLDEDSSVKIEAALALIKHSKNDELLNKSVDVLIKNLQNHEDYLLAVLDCLLKVSDVVNLSRYTMDILNYLSPYDLNVSRKILEFVFAVSETQEFVSVLNFISYKYNQYNNMTLKSKNINILILDEVSIFVSRYSIYDDNLISICLSNISSEHPGLSYSSLNLLSHVLKILSHKKSINANENFFYDKILDELVINLYKIRYGKILRFVMELCIQYVDFKHFDRIIESLENSFQSPKKPIFLKTGNCLLIPFICIGITDIFIKLYKNNDDERKSQLIALMLKFIRHSKKKGTFNSGSYATIVSCIRTLTSGIVNTEIHVETSSNLVKSCVLEPLDFTFVKVEANEKIESLNKFLNSKEYNESITNVVQLTGLSDPIYVEANVMYRRFEIVLDVLLINQTDNYLQNMLFDFGTSQNLQSSYAAMPTSMKARSALSKKIVFRVLDSSNGFINGSVTFKYPGKTGEYANQNYTLNFSEIKTNVSDFLETKKCTSEDFRDLWKKLEWENVYVVKLTTKKDLKSVFTAFEKKLKGFVVDLRITDNALVGNISATTRQNNDIFFNISMSKDVNTINLECRIRSVKEEIVKSLSIIVSDVVKSLKNK